MRPAAFAFILAISVFGACPAGAAESVTTALNVDDGSCKPIGGPPTQEDIDLGVSALLCPGYRDYPVEYNTDDERTTVHFGDPAHATTSSVWESFLPFNSAGDSVEWRLDGKGTPYAAILLFRVGAGDPDTATPPPRGQVLVISKVGQPDAPAGCVVGLVDALANADADRLARDVADRLAPGFACGRDKAVYHGRRGERAADFQADF